MSTVHGRAVATICRLPISSDMKMNTSGSNSGEIRSYVQLQHQTHDALREQHPEWIEPNGDCPTCETYKSRLAELLRLSSPSETAQLRNQPANRTTQHYEYEY
jgi:hypothetical protein